ncbi:MAG: S1/P1 nuclease [Janthinobacterium lividum]
MPKWWLFLAIALIQPQPARAWGDEGHQIIALVADAMLTPSARTQVDALLALDEDPLSDHDIASAATWADHLRDSNADDARARTRQWHFANIERQDPSLSDACFGQPKLPPAALASRGPAQACLVDKIDQFAAELAAPDTTADERLLDLKFLLHFVGDLHQPLHASDDFDRGGNDKRASAQGIRAGNLHHYWDTEFVQMLGRDPVQVAQALIPTISATDRRRWSAGTPATWALESFQLANRDAYGQLPEPTPSGSYRLTPRYVELATRDTTLQLAKAGTRLAALLNRSLRPH